MVKEYGDDGERAQAVQARTVRKPYVRGAWRCAGASVRSLAAGRGVGHLRLSQRMFRRFPPSKSMKVILAQSYRAMQGQADRIVLHLVLFPRWSGPDQPSRSWSRGRWLMSGAPVKLSRSPPERSSTCDRDALLGEVGPEQRVDERELTRVELTYDDQQEQLFEVLVRPLDEANVLRWGAEVLEEGNQPL